MLKPRRRRRSTEASSTDSPRTRLNTHLVLKKNVFLHAHAHVLNDFFDFVQRIKELEERVRTMADVIAGLERRLKELSKGDASLPATLARIRAANEGGNGEL